MCSVVTEKFTWTTTTCSKKSSALKTNDDDDDDIHIMLCDNSHLCASIRHIRRQPLTARAHQHLHDTLHPHHRKDCRRRARRARSCAFVLLRAQRPHQRQRGAPAFLHPHAIHIYTTPALCQQRYSTRQKRTKKELMRPASVFVCWFCGTDIIMHSRVR